MIKSHTDIEQSKKLAEFLPLESADMIFVHTIDLEGDEHYDIDFRNKNPLFENDVCAWSLAALIDVFEDKGFFYKLYFDGVSNVLEVVNIDNHNIHEMNYNDYPIDACVEMIEKLHERKML